MFICDRYFLYVDLLFDHKLQSDCLLVNLLYHLFQLIQIRFVHLITLILVLFLTNLRSQNETKIILTKGVVFKNDQITGNVKKHTFFSKILNNEREVYVWIPEDYNQKNKKYPLLIAHDGGAVFYSRGGFGSKNKSKAEIIKNGWNLDELSLIHI